MGSQDILDVVDIQGQTATFSGIVNALNFIGLEKTTNVTTTSPVAIPSTFTNQTYFISAAASLTLSVDAPIGTKITFIASIANANLKIIPGAGQVIKLNGSDCATSLYSAGIWAQVTLQLATTDTWVALNNNSFSIT